MSDEGEFIFNAKPDPKCKHCNREKGKHRATTFQCPTTRHAFTAFHQTNVYEPIQKKKDDK